MIRPLLTASLALALAMAAAPAPAQNRAPENLRSVPVPVRVQMIEREYASQSRGRQISDDQLEYYLDRVNAGWGFSRISQDIATSLLGNGNWRPGAGWNQQAVTCSSNDRRRRECQTPFRGRAVLVENISSTACVEGRNWGSGSGMIWVDGGCRGRFAPAGGWGAGGNVGNAGSTLRCESQDRRERTCPTPGWRGATLVRQLSSTRCVEGSNWGWRSGVLWVSNGCRGEFAAGRGGWGSNAGPGNYSVSCSSENNRQRSCAWDRRQGRPVLVEQISKTRCVEGRNWGLEGNAIWVNGGCRARFGAR